MNLKGILGKRIILVLLGFVFLGICANLYAFGLGTGGLPPPPPPPPPPPTPSLAIFSPTKSPSYATSHWILSIGVLADNASSVTWTNNRGGSGVIGGMDGGGVDLLFNGINLQPGQNEITFYAFDLGGSPTSVTATLSVAYTPPPPPKITISTPTPGQRTLKAVFAVAGKAHGDAGVTNVWVQLNTNGWQLATGTTNWSADLSLTTRSNLVEAYAVDQAGSYSKTSSVSLLYFPGDWLTVNTNGLGRISPNDNGTLLEIGQTYKLKAFAAAGFVFSNWTGNVNGTVVLSNNQAALSFVMQSNLVLTAAFTDVQRPVVAITDLKANQRVSHALFTVTGRASDNWGVAGVWVQLNNGNWTNASPSDLSLGWSDWSVDVNLLTAGANTLRAFARDRAGNYSRTNTVDFFYVPPPPDNISYVGGDGSVIITLRPPPLAPLQVETSNPNAVIVSGSLQMRLSGPEGALVVVESSTDLIHWNPVETNTMPPGGLPLTVPINGVPAQFFRAVPQ